MLLNNSFFELKVDIVIWLFWILWSFSLIGEEWENVIGYSFYDFDC